jgi:hypothetical protein
VVAWLAHGTLAFETPDGPRIALLSLSAPALAVSGAIAAGVVLIARAGAPLAPLSLLVLLLLPWMPLPVPAAFFVWEGQFGLLVWSAVVVLLLAGAARRRGVGPWLESRRLVAATRPEILAVALSGLVFGAAAWRAAPAVPGGDEPHYLVIAQSLLLDGDLRIENNHRRRDYQPYYPGPLRPDFIRRGRDGEIYSIHAPGISAIVAPAFAAGGYPAVVVFLVALAALTGGLVWYVAWLATRDRSAAWFGWASVSLCATTIFHSFTVYPDGVGGALTLTGVWALLRAEQERLAVGGPRATALHDRTGQTSWMVWLLHGAALAALPWLHTRFAVLAMGLGALILLRLSSAPNPSGKAVAFLAIPAIGALCWIGYFVAIYGTPDPSAPYGGTREFSTAFIPGGMAGLFFDQRFGLLATAPVLAFGPIGLVMMAIRGTRAPAARGPRPGRRLGLELIFVIAPYLLTVTNYAMWWGGWSAPARFAAVVVPVLAIPCAAAWAGFRASACRLLMSGALGLTTFVSGVLVIAERGRLAFNTRETSALWLDWASTLADLGRGFPLWVRGAESTFFVEILIWIAAAGLCAVLVTCLLRVFKDRSPEAAGTVLAWVLGVVVMGAVTATWRVHGVDGITPARAQMTLLRRLSADSRPLMVRLEPFSRVDAGVALATMRIEPAGRDAAAAPARGIRPLLVLPAVPAGRYRIQPRGVRPGGMLFVGINQDQFALRTEQVANPPQAIEVDFPVDVRALVIGGDEDARRSIDGFTIEPLATVPAAARLTDQFARRAVRYGRASVFFLDDRSFPEPEAFWIGGARSSSIVFQPDGTTDPVRLLLRNAPVQNRLTVQAGAWRAEIDLAPGEERQVEIPLDSGRGAALITFGVSSGFRPSEVEPGSRDERFLGVWVQPVT